MNIKLFGKALFEFNKTNSYLVPQAFNNIKESKYLPDFNRNIANNSLNSYIMDISTPGSSTVQRKSEEKPAVETLTPKEVYNLKMLHDQTFELNTDIEYVDKQVEDLKEKLNLLKAEEFDMQRGVDQISSILIRMENRKKYSEFKEFFEEFPYTTTSKIQELVKAHDYLKLGEVAQFLADMPAEAVKIMKDYNSQTEKMCGKKAVFYIIADKKDFEKTEKRRDPILLAQSPFGHFWQMLGAWDKEMLLIEEL